jgi:amidase
LTQLHDLTAAEQLAQLRARTLSSVELTEHYLDRVLRYDADLGAFVEITAELARQEAVAADAELDRGSTLPLLGIPLAYKDLFAVAGVRATLGSRAVDVVPAENGHTVGLLRAAGAVTVGTTHAPELGPTCFTHSDVVGRPAVTPFDTSRYASGSSGGAAAAVAAGLLPFAHGSDGAGSLRTPAAVCGLVGVKPSRGVLRSAPGFLSWATEGPLARTVADAALLLDVMASPSDLYGLAMSGFSASLETPVPKALRVFSFSNSGLSSVEPALLEVHAAAVEVLRGLGHEVVEGDNPVPWSDELIHHLTVIVTSSVATAAAQLGDPTLLQPYTRFCLDQARAYSAADFVTAQAALAQAAATVLAGCSPFDLVLSPVISATARPLGWFEQDGGGEGCGRRMLDWSAFTPWANLTGQPALSLPLALIDGVPAGIQLTATPGADLLLLRVAAQLEQAKPFVHHPKQW